MPHVIEKTAWKFDELEDRAKERARSWWREASAGANDTLEHILDDAAQVAAMLGIELDTKPVKLMGGGTRHDPVIYWSGFSSQGDGACFEGSYSYAKGAAKAIRAHAPQDTELHRIADELQALQRPHMYRLTARMKHRGHYQHSGCMTVDVDGNVMRDDRPRGATAEGDLTQLMRDFADWIYRQLEREYEWQNADEQVDDNIRANEYEFDETGRLA